MTAGLSCVNGRKTFFVFLYLFQRNLKIHMSRTFEVVSFVRCRDSPEYGVGYAGVGTIWLALHVTIIFMLNDFIPSSMHIFKMYQRPSLLSSLDTFLR